MPAPRAAAKTLLRRHQSQGGPRCEARFPGRKRKSKAVEPPPPKRAATAKKASAKREPARKKKPRGQEIRPLKKSPVKKAPRQESAGKDADGQETSRGKEAGGQESGVAQGPEAHPAKGRVRRRRQKEETRGEAPLISIFYRGQRHWRISHASGILLSSVRITRARRPS